jgi:hypothetical protein
LDEAGPVRVSDDRFQYRGAWPSVGAGIHRGGVGFDDAAGSFAVDDPHHDGAGFRAGEFGHHRDPEPADPECHGHQETLGVLGEVVVDGWCGEHIKVRE